MDAVEVVTFGTAFFFRSLERPKCFLVPVTDYEILEVRETRVVLKHVAGIDKTIKIGGGREVVPPKSVKPAVSTEEAREEEVEERPAPRKAAGRKEAVAAEPPKERKRERRKHRRRRGRDDETPGDEDEVSAAGTDEEGSSDGPRDEEGVVRQMPPALSTIIPPPMHLISESIAKYKLMLAGAAAEDVKIEAKEEMVAISDEGGPPQEILSQLDEEAADGEELESPGLMSSFSPTHLLRRFRGKGVAAEEVESKPEAPEEE